MSYFYVEVFVAHLAMAAILFLGVNWIGKHAIEFGYASTTLFEDVTENLALNFFLRAMSPAVFIIAASASAVAIGQPDWRLGIQWVVIYYYLIRAAAIVLLARQQLISWPRFALHAIAGIALAMLAYHNLILPNRSLLPNLEQVGNELWLAIFAFLYAVANKVPVEGGPGARRRNNFVRTHYEHARARFGDLIDKAATDERLKLIVYAVLVYEDYARPVAIRWIERLMFWKPYRTTGIMQVASDTPLSDSASVARGVERLKRSWEANAAEEYRYDRVRNTIGGYNTDSDYIGRVSEIMQVLAVRVDPKLRAAYDSLYS